MLLTAETLLTGRELLRPAWIDVSDGTVVALGAGSAPRPADRDLGAVTVVPGFVDTHVHGGDGANFSAASAAETSTAVAIHRRHGTTTLVASLVTASADELLRQVTGLAPDVHAGLLAGIHLEGPWLSAKRCGAHQPALMRDPDPAEVDRVLVAGQGAIRMVTLAPERDGALAAIERIVDDGVVAAVGHTEATYAQTRAAITAGAVVGVIAVNVVTSGVFSPLLAIGTGSAGAAPLTAGVAFFAVREAVWHGLVLVSGPAAVVSVGAPVDAALRDGYTTPGTLALALGESARRAEELVVNAGASIGETVGSWWEGL